MVVLSVSVILVLLVPLLVETTSSNFNVLQVCMLQSEHGKVFDTLGRGPLKM